MQLGLHGPFIRTTMSTVPQRRKRTKNRHSRANKGEPEPKRIRLEDEEDDDATETLANCLIVTLPFELVAEILLYSKSPRDLLAVSRTCKHFFATLTSVRAAYVWKNARKDCLPRPLPEPLARQSEHSHAAFIFGGPGKCEVCW